MSKKYTLNRDDLESLGRGLLITLAGAALTFIAEQLPNVDFGIYTPYVVPVFALLVNVGRKFLAGK